PPPPRLTADTTAIAIPMSTRQPSACGAPLFGLVGTGRGSGGGTGGGGRGAGGGGGAGGDGDGAAGGFAAALSRPGRTQSRTQSGAGPALPGAATLDAPADGAGAGGGGDAGAAGFGADGFPRVGGCFSGRSAAGATSNSTSSSPSVACAGAARLEPGA